MVAIQFYIWWNFFSNNILWQQKKNIFDLICWFYMGIRIGLWHRIAIVFLHKIVTFYFFYKSLVYIFFLFLLTETLFKVYVSVCRNKNWAGVAGWRLKPAGKGSVRRVCGWRAGEDFPLLYYSLAWNLFFLPAFLEEKYDFGYR